MLRRLIASIATALWASLALAAVPDPGSSPSVRVQREPAPQMSSRILAGSPSAPEHFRASHVRPVDVVTLERPEKATVPTMDAQGRLRIASVRALPKAASVPDWVAIPEGFVSTLRASSDDAKGMRVRLDIGRLAAPLEIRAQGTDGKIESLVVDPSHDAEVWTAWTEGSSQVIELFSPAGAPLPAANVVAVLHFDASPVEKAAASCTVPAACSTGDAALDNAIAERVKSSVRLSFVEGSSGFLCSGTLVNTDKFPNGYLLTANHCISTAAVASSVASFWFYEPTSCDDASLKPGMVQVSGGASLVFTNYNADATLLLMNQSPPAGAAYSGWNAAALAAGDRIVSISHPKGDTARIALGSVADSSIRISGRAQDEYGISFDRGIIEGGSSGSGLFTLQGGSLVLRGILTGTTITNSPTGLSCTNLQELALYGRYEILHAEIMPYVTASGAPAPDDTPNRSLDYAGVAPDAPLDGRTVTLDRSIETLGDVDVFRFNLNASASVTVGTQGSMDTVGTLLDSQGKAIVTNDDVSPPSNTNFGITRTLAAGTYYVMVAPWDPGVTGPYRFSMSATTPPPTVTNYTDLWWTSDQSGWGINLAHQGDIIFALLYTYDTNGAPMWLVMSNGDKQTDGTFAGTLYRSAGPWYGSPGWTGNTLTQVGTMQLGFSSANTANLTYTVNGVSVSKSIRRFAYATPATTCSFTTASRASSTNYQDLWWNPAESGWGISIVHQGNILFGLIYIYDSSGQGLWLSMSNGAQTGPRTFSGALYRSTGPAFNASPWGPVQLEQVGTMTLAFTDGENGTLTYTVNSLQVVKQIKRTVYSNPTPVCTAASS